MVVLILLMTLFTQDLVLEKTISNSWNKQFSHYQNSYQSYASWILVFILVDLNTF